MFDILSPKTSFAKLGAFFRSRSDSISGEGGSPPPASVDFQLMIASSAQMYQGIVIKNAPP